MATKYQQGRDTEYMAIAQLERDGWRATRSAGSHKEADVIAWNRYGSRYVQCKRYTDRPGDFTKDLGQLMSMELPPNASAELWVRRHGVPGWIERTLVRSTYPERMDVSDLDDLGAEEQFTRPIFEDKVRVMALDIAKKAKEERWKQRQKTNKPPRASSASSSKSPTTATPAATGTEVPPSAPGPATHV